MCIRDRWWLRATEEQRALEVRMRQLAAEGVPRTGRRPTHAEYIQAARAGHGSRVARALYQRWGSSFVSKGDLSHGRVCGRTESCLVDALCNAARMLGVALRESALRKLALQPIPGEESSVCASWRLIQRALLSQQAPIVETPCKPRFDSSGPAMLNLVLCRVGVYVLCLQVTVDGREFRHAIAYNAAQGILIDSHSSNRAMQLDDRDRRGRKTASAAFKRLISQRSVLENKAISVDVSQVYEIEKQSK
eukprot:689152-Pleurochrysis_carterae.AAC.1